MKFRLEKDIENAYVALATAIGCMCTKMNTQGYKSRPDQLVILPQSGIIWLEFKRPKIKVYPRQAWYHRELHKREQICETFDDENYAIAFTQACMASARLSRGRGPCYAEPSLCGPSYGSRPREDIYSPYGFEVIEALRHQQEVAGNSTPESLLQRMAEGNTEVDKLSRADGKHNTWSVKGSYPPHRG